MNNAILNDDLVAVQAGNIVVYNYDGETRNIFPNQLNILLWVSVFRQFLFRCPGRT